MTADFQNLMKYMNVNIQKAQWIPSKMNSKRPTLRHVIIKLPKDKENLESSKEK